MLKWNPQSEHKWWDEIWENIEQAKREIKKRYMTILIALIDKNAENVSKWKVHTAQPEICWEALVKTLEEQ